MPDNIYEALRESHALQRSLLRKLLRTRPGDARRAELFQALRVELAAHAAAEERFLYAPILMDDRGLDPSRHALSEHHEIDECVEKLQSLDISGEAWMEHCKQLSHEVHHHLREEEKRFFQVSGKILTETQKLRLAGRYRKDYVRMHRTISQGA